MVFQFELKRYGQKVNSNTYHFLAYVIMTSNKFKFYFLLFFDLFDLKFELKISLFINEQLC